MRNGSTFIHPPLYDAMYGLTLEMVMKQLLMEQGYEVIAAHDYEDFLGFDPEELVEIAREHNSHSAKQVDFNLEWQNLSHKGILDHYFKVDDLLRLPYNKKKGERPVNVGIQWFNYSYEDKKKRDPDKIIKEKEAQLKASWQACKEIYLDRVVLVAVYVSPTWKGLGLRSEYENEQIKSMIYELIKSVREPSSGPTTLRLSL
jgi:hypothetical protein